MSALTVAPIGTCRLNTPLRRGVLRLGYRLQLARNYGFTHTSAEALQQLRYMLGEISFPKDVSRLIFRPVLTQAQKSQSHEVADLYLVEISSAKMITCRGNFVQLNYVNRYFADFFSDKVRSRKFWSLATEGRAPELAAWLAGEAAFDRLDAASRSLLSDLRQSEVSPATLDEDVGGIVDRLGADRIVLVTHVDAQLPDGSVIGSRSRLISDVAACAERRGLRCFDPTPLMRAFGQAQAMEKDGLDLTHFTESFSDHLCDAIHATFMQSNERTVVELAPIVGASRAVQIRAAEIETAWLAGNFRKASRDARKAVAAEQTAPEFRHLLGKMQFELGDYAAAEANLNMARETLGSDGDLDRMLMLTSFELGKFDVALSLGEALLGDETESAEILRVCALSAMASGRPEVAIDLWARLFHLDAAGEAGGEAAEAALALIIAAGDIDGARNWAEVVLAAMPGQRDALVYLWRDGIARRDRARLLDLVAQCALLAPAAATALVVEAQDFCPLAAARLATQLLRDGQFELVAWARLTSAEWTRLAVEATEQGRLTDALEPTQAAGVLRPDDAALIRARRTLARALRLDTRSALLEKDLNRVAANGEEALKTGFEFPEMDAFLGKAYLELGRADDALRHLRRAAAAAPDPGSAWLQVARSALRLERYTDAVLACLEAKRAPDTTVAGDAEQLLSAMSSRALKAIRAMSSAGQAEEAWALADAMHGCRADAAAIVREKAATLRALRNDIARVEKSDGVQRLVLSQRLLALDPTDAFALRTAAVEAMRAHKFAASLQYWLDLKSSGSQLPRLEANIGKCRLWLGRQQRVRSAATLAA